MDNILDTDLCSDSDSNSYDSVLRLINMTNEISRIRRDIEDINNVSHSDFLLESIDSLNNSIDQMRKYIETVINNKYKRRLLNISDDINPNDKFPSNLSGSYRQRHKRILNIRATKYNSEEGVMYKSKSMPNLRTR